MPDRVTAVGPAVGPCSPVVNAAAPVASNRSMRWCITGHLLGVLAITGLLACSPGGEAVGADAASAIDAATDADLGPLDDGFGGGAGYVSPFIGIAEKVRVRPDGDLIVCGVEEGLRQELEVIRMRPDGAIDATFASAGVFSEPGEVGCNDLRLLADGRIVVVAPTRLIVLGPDGAYDPLTSVIRPPTGGATLSYYHRAVPAPGGGMYLIGQVHTGVMIWRLTEALTLDPTFGGGAPVLVPRDATLADGATLVALPGGPALVVGGGWAVPINPDTSVVHDELIWLDAITGARLGAPLESIAPPLVRAFATLIGGELMVLTSDRTVTVRAADGTLATSWRVADCGGGFPALYASDTRRDPAGRVLVLLGDRVIRLAASGRAVDASFGCDGSLAFTLPDPVPDPLFGDAAFAFDLAPDGTIVVVGARAESRTVPRAWYVTRLVP